MSCSYEDARSPLYGARVRDPVLQRRRASPGGQGRLIYQRGQEADSTSPENLAEACEFLGIPYRETWFEDFHDPLTPVGRTTPLQMDARWSGAVSYSPLAR